jgi:hypothetical protein
MQSAFDQAATDRPVSSLAGGLAGAIVPIGGASSQARSLGGRVVEGLKTGGMFGTLYGVNSAQEGEERKRALMGGGAGVALGAAAPVAIKGAGMFGNAAKDAALRSDTVRGALNAIDDEIYRRPLATSQVQMSTGVPMIPPRSRPGRGTPRFTAPANGVARRAAKYADRAGIDASELDARIAAAQADPRGRTMAEMLGQPGMDAAATLGRMPGKTGELATTQLEARNAGQGLRLERDLSGQSEQSAVDFLSQRTRDVAEQHLEPVWRQPRTPSDDAVFGHMLRRPEVAEAEPAARRTMQGLIARGRLAPDALNDPAQVMHYIKMEIADTAKNPLKVKAGIRSTDNSNLNAAVGDISTVLDLIRPGYAQAMRELSDAIAPRELAKKMANVRGIDPNRARAILSNPDTARELGRPGLQNFGRALEEENQLYRNAGRMMPSTNSITSNAMLGAADESAMGMSNVPASKTGILSAALNYWRQGVNETQRNEAGRFLLRVVDDPDSGLTPEERQGITNELMRIYRERQAQTAATRGAARAAAGPANALQGQ